MPEQLALHYSPAWQVSEAWPRVLEEVRRVVTALGLKQAAYDLDTTPSYLAHALAERDRKYLRGEWLAYFVARDTTTGLLGALADLAGCDVKKREPLTPTEKLARLEGALAELGPELRDLITRKAGI